MKETPAPGGRAHIMWREISAGSGLVHSGYRYKLIGNYGFEVETVISIRNYQDMDWDSVSSIHDRARRLELELADLKEAFLPLRIAAEREGLFDYPGLYVAEEKGTVIGFVACTEDELAWLYVAPEKMRRGVGRSLSQYAMKMHPGIRYIEALKGNVPALKLYESLGFRLKGIEEGKMPGNKSFTVQVYSLERTV